MRAEAGHINKEQLIGCFRHVTKVWLHASPAKACARPPWRVAVQVLACEHPGVWRLMDLARASEDASDSSMPPDKTCSAVFLRRHM